MTFVALTLGVFLLALLFERLALDRLRASIPTVITVTGTRGKSTVVRLLASVLRESGRTVLAKTTGSQAQYVMPDGSIVDIPRRGLVSILEQKRTLKTAAALGVEYLVVEVMSVQPENHLVESRKILRPDIVLLTNVRKDHTEAMGETESEIARVLGLGFVRGSKVFLPEESRSLLESHHLESFTVRAVPAHSAIAEIGSITLNTPGKQAMASNYDLVRAAAGEMGLSEDVIRRGMQRVVQDIGEFKVWTYRIGEKRIFVVNAFAANDPFSTFTLLHEVRNALPKETGAVAGLLNLRSDRGDRTVQWIRALQSEAASEFGTLFVTGGHAHALSRRLNDVTVVTERTPEDVMKNIGAQLADGGVLFGFGNIGGMGVKLVDHWRQTGEEYGI